MTETTTTATDPARIVDFMQPACAQYTALMQDLAGDNLAGLTAYGPVLDSDFDATRMTASSVLVLDQIDLSLLRRIAEHGPELGRKHLAAPVVMTPDYIRGSLDTFPLELLEIHQHHATLAGRDFFDDLTFQTEHVRLQCEREFKRILIRLRQGLLAASGRELAIEELELDIGQHILRTARGLLWLKGKADHASRDTVVSECERLVGDSLPGIRGALELYGEHGMRQFDALYHDVESLAQVADEL